MDNPRPEKVAVVDEVRQRLGDADGAILTEYRGMTVKDIATLRRSLREVGGEYKIYKNTLVRIAAKGAGLDELEPLLEGPTAIAFVSGDAAAVAKALRDFSRTNPHLVLKGGVLGTRIITGKDTAALADLPSRDVLLARLAGGMAAPMQQLAGLLQALPRNFAYGLKALIEKGGSPAAPQPAPEPAADAAPEAAAEAPVLAESPASDATAVAPDGDTEPVAEAASEPGPEPELAPAEDLAPAEEAVVEPAPEPETEPTTEITESEAPAAEAETTEGE